MRQGFHTAGVVYAGNHPSRKQNVPYGSHLVFFPNSFFKVSKVFTIFKVSKVSKFLRYFPNSGHRQPDSRYTNFLSLGVYIAFLDIIGSL